MAEFQIRDIGRELYEGGPKAPYWHARVVMGGESFNVDRREGSWMRVYEDGSRTEVIPEVAAALQARVRPLEKKEARVAATP